MIDRYTKAVLTVIALALVVIGVRLNVPSAQAQVGASCGSAIFPCYVDALKPGLPVQVTNVR